MEKGKATSSIKTQMQVHGRIVLAGCAVVLVVAVFILHTAGQKGSSSVSFLPTHNQTSLLAGTEAAESTSSAKTTATSTALAATASSTSSTAGIPTNLVSQSNTAASTNSAAVNTPQAGTASAKALVSSGGRLLDAMVNIVCVSSVPQIPSISGSGVIIDPRGIIITAAHVAQLFTLEDYLGSNKVSCLIRTGSPARRAYLAEPIYVSPLWIQANPKTLDTTSPQGTGENDFAFLGITATATSTPLPGNYPYIPLSQVDPQINDPVAIGSFGAQYLSSSEVNTGLYPILVFGSIQNRYTFHSNTMDLVSIVGSAASQEGSSGGGIANAEGGLVGVITTSSISGDFSDRSLNAVTVSHMRRSYAADTGGDLDAMLRSASVSALINGFSSQSQSLGQFLYQNL